MIEMRVVGAFAVCRAGRVVPAVEVGSRKARTLLAVLAMHRGELRPDRIADSLWGDHLPRRPEANVATLVSRLRSAFGEETIVRGCLGYRLGDQVRVDLFEAADHLAEAEQRIHGAQPALALMAARRAVHLLDKGAVLAEEPEARWADPARMRAEALLRRARAAVAETALRLGDARAARVAAQAAVNTDCFDEEACRMLMRAHHAADEPAQALRAYQRLRSTLSAELGIHPARATRDLHVAILQDTKAG